MLKTFRLRKLSRQNFVVHNSVRIIPSQTVLVGYVFNLNQIFLIKKNLLVTTDGMKLNLLYRTC